MRHDRQPANRRRLIYLTIALAPFLLFGALRGSIQLATIQMLRHYPAPGQMVSAGGHKLHLYCIGKGSPTMVIETGIGTDWTSWRSVSSRLAEMGRVCVYDRAGYGWSEAGPKPRTARQIASELHLLLSNAGITGPYVLIGHSFGGYVTRIYASQFRESVLGIVLVDPMHEDERRMARLAETPAAPGGETALQRLNIHDMLAFIPPSGAARFIRLCKGERSLPDEAKDWPRAFRDRLLIGSSLDQLIAERNEYDTLAESEAQVRKSEFPRTVSLTVLTALRMLPRQNPKAFVFPSFHRELQRQLAQLSDFGKQIIAEDSGHMIQIYEPELIVNAVSAAVHKCDVPN